MMIENLSNMSAFQGQDYRTEKKTELEAVRSIEESGESPTTKLDIERQGVARNQHARAPGDEFEALIYNDKGLVNQNPEHEYENPEGQPSIDLFV